MATFRIHTARSILTLRLDSDDVDIESVGRRLGRDRFVVGDLVEENGQPVEPSVRVLVPGQRIDLIAADDLE